MKIPTIVILISLLLSALSIFSQPINEQERVISRHPMLKPLPPKFTDKINLPDYILKNRDDKKALETLKKIVIDTRKDLVISSIDIPFDECKQDFIDGMRLFSNRLSDIDHVIQSYYCNKTHLSITIHYYYFQDDEKAKSGANELIQQSAGVFYEDQVNKSPLSKQFGDFFIYDRSPEGNSLSLRILDDKYYIYINCTRKQAIQDEIIGQWAEAVLNKITKGDNN